MNRNANDIIQNDRLKKHQEGGYFVETFVSSNIIEVDSNFIGGKRPEVSKINYLLSKDDFSAWHRLEADETWRFKEGASLLLHILQHNGELLQIKLGDPKIESDVISEFCVTRKQWFAASLTNEHLFSYVECEVRPGFDYRDWQLGKKDFLLNLYPQHRLIIEKYARDKVAN